MKAVEHRAAQLFDYAISQPKGFKNEDAMLVFGWDLEMFNQAARQLRLELGADEITLVCDPGTKGERWTYRLVGTYQEAEPWCINRIDDMEARLETVHAVSKTVASNADGRSLVGKKARRIERTVGYLLSELGDLSGQ